MSTETTPILNAMDGYDKVYVAAAALCIVIAIGCAPYLDRENWSYLAGPLFTLVSGLLLIVAIRFQIREHKLALAELRQTNANHAELARIATQEKEFHVCMQAYGQLRDRWGLLCAGTDPKDVGTVRGWYTRVEPGLEQYKPDVFYSTTGRYWMFQREEFNRDRLPPFFVQVREVVYTMKWLTAALQKKALSPDDRLHLLTLYRSVQQDAHDRIGHWLVKATTLINELLKATPPREEQRIDLGRLMEVRDRYVQPLLHVLNEADGGLTKLEREVGQPLGWTRMPDVEGHAR